MNPLQVPALLKAASKTAPRTWIPNLGISKWLTSQNQMARHRAMESNVGGKGFLRHLLQTSDRKKLTRSDYLELKRQGLLDDYYKLLKAQKEGPQSYKAVVDEVKSSIGSNTKAKQELIDRLIFNSKDPTLRDIGWTAKVPLGGHLLNAGARANNFLERFWLSPVNSPINAGLRAGEKGLWNLEKFLRDRGYNRLANAAGGTAGTLNLASESSLGALRVLNAASILKALNIVDPYVGVEAARKGLYGAYTSVRDPIANYLYPPKEEESGGGGSGSSGSSSSEASAYDKLLTEIGEKREAGDESFLKSVTDLLGKVESGKFSEKEKKTLLAEVEKNRFNADQTIRAGKARDWVDATGDLTKVPGLSVARPVYNLWSLPGRVSQKILASVPGLGAGDAAENPEIKAMRANPFGAFHSMLPSWVPGADNSETAKLQRSIAYKLAPYAIRDHLRAVESTSKGPDANYSSGITHHYQGYTLGGVAKNLVHRLGDRLLERVAPSQFGPDIKWKYEATKGSGLPTDIWSPKPYSRDDTPTSTIVREELQEYLPRILRNYDAELASPAGARVARLLKPILDDPKQLASVVARMPDSPESADFKTMLRELAPQISAASKAGTLGDLLKTPQVRLALGGALDPTTADPLQDSRGNLINKATSRVFRDWEDLTKYDKERIFKPDGMRYPNALPSKIPVKEEDRKDLSAAWSDFKEQYQKNKDLLGTSNYYNPSDPRSQVSTSTEKLPLGTGTALWAAKGTIPDFMKPLLFTLARAEQAGTSPEHGGIPLSDKQVKTLDPIISKKDDLAGSSFRAAYRPNMSNYTDLGGRLVTRAEPYVTHGVKTYITDPVAQTAKDIYDKREPIYNKLGPAGVLLGTAGALAGPKELGGFSAALGTASMLPLLMHQWDSKKPDQYGKSFGTNLALAALPTAAYLGKQWVMQRPEDEEEENLETKERSVTPPGVESGDSLGKSLATRLPNQPLQEEKQAGDMLGHHLHQVLVKRADTPSFDEFSSEWTPEHVKRMFEADQLQAKTLRQEILDLAGKKPDLRSSGIYPRGRTAAHAMGAYNDFVENNWFRTIPKDRRTPEMVEWYENQKRELRALAERFQSPISEKPSPEREPPKQGKKDSSGGSSTQPTSPQVNPTQQSSWYTNPAYLLGGAAALGGGALAANAAYNYFNPQEEEEEQDTLGKSLSKRLPS